MNSTIEQVVNGLRERFGDAVEDVREFRDDVIVVLSRDGVPARQRRSALSPL